MPSEGWHGLADFDLHDHSSAESANPTSPKMILPFLCPGETVERVQLKTEIPQLAACWILKDGASGTGASSPAAKMPDGASHRTQFGAPRLRSAPTPPTGMMPAIPSTVLSASPVGRRRLRGSYDPYPSDLPPRYLRRVQIDALNHRPNRSRLHRPG
jgi:hypothetical protein